MTAVQVNSMNVELWRSIAAIADSEPLMARLTKYARKLVKENEDSALYTKDEFIARVDEAKKGNSMKFSSVEELDKHIRSL
ncbi:MAG: hypothetical protein IKQ72_02710 [Bacteroidaceae bacterium]|nr:hypothetical protein [Bacteroidaceae bacterium]